MHIYEHIVHCTNREVKDIIKLYSYRTTETIFAKYIQEKELKEMTDAMNTMFKKPGIWRKLVVALLTAALLLTFAACGETAQEQLRALAGEGEAEEQLRQQLMNEDVTEIVIQGTLYLSEPAEVAGNKTIKGDGKIKAVGNWAGEDAYLLSIASGTEIVLAQSVTIDADGVSGGVYVSDGAALTVTEDATVCGAAMDSANVMAVGSVQVSGGYLKDSKGHNLYAANDAVIDGGVISGSGAEFSGVYVAGHLEQNGGEINGAYNNVYVAEGGCFIWNAGSNLEAKNDGVYVDEGAELKVTSATAVLKNAGAQGVHLAGNATVDGILITGCQENQIKVEETSELVVNDCTLSGSYGHGITNRGKLTVNSGDITGAVSCGIVNTGVLEVNGGGIRTNGNKGILVKNGGSLVIANENVAISGNVVGVAVEENATADISKAKINSNTLNNISCFGELYIHDIIMGGSGSNCIATNYGGHVVAKNMEIISTNGNNGIYNINGSLVELTDCIISGTKTNAIRNLDADLVGTNVTISNCGGGISTGDYIFGEAGSVKITNLTTSGVSGSNVSTEAYCGGTIELTNATLGATGSNNLSVKGGHLILTDAVVDGNNPNYEGTTHGILMDEGGKITATNVTISNTKFSGIRNRGGYFEGTNVTLTNIGQDGISNASHGTTKAPGVVVIKGLKTYFVGQNNIDNNSKGGTVAIYGGYLCQTVNNSVANYNGTTIVDQVKLEGTVPSWSDYLYGFMITGGTVKATDVEVGPCYAASIRIKGGDFVGTNITTKGGVMFAWNGGGDITIDGLVTENVSENNIKIDAANATISITNGKLCGTNHNNIRLYKGVVTLKDTDITGHIENAKNQEVHAVMLTGGELNLENVTIHDSIRAGIRNKGGVVNGKNVTLKDVKTVGISFSGGTIKLDGLTTENVGAENIAADSGSISVANATFCKNDSGNSIAIKGANLTLTDSEIMGTKGSAAHAIYITKGSVTAKDLKISGTGGSGLRVAGGVTTVDNVTISDAGGSALQVSGGTLTVNGMTTSNIGANNINMYANATVTVNGYADGTASTLGVSGAENNSLMITAGTVALNNVNVLGTPDGTAAVYTKGSTLTLNDTGVTGAVENNGILTVTGGSVTGDVNNYGALTIGNVYVSGMVYSDTVINYVGNQTPHTKEDPMKLDSADLTEAKVMVKTQDAATAAALAETFVAPNAGLPMEAKDSTIRIFLDPNTYVARVGDKKFTTLSEAIAHAASVSTADTAAVIEIIHDISLDGTVVIPENANIIITDDGTARTLTRSTSFNPKARGVLFDVSAGVKLTITSTGNDSDPKLTIDGNNDEITAVSGANWAMLAAASGCNTITIEDGVRFVNNSSTGAGTVIRMVANSGTLNITGGLFEGNTNVSNRGGVIYAESGSVVNISNATFRNNHVAGLGGVLSIINGAKVTVDNCLFEGNSSDNNGGVLDVNTTGKGDVVIRNSIIRNNSANKGGAVNLPTGCCLSIENCTFEGNTSNSEGRDIRMGGATSKVYLSGKVVAYVHNQNKSTVYVEGTLAEGSNVEVHWLVNDAARIPAVAVQFDSAAAAAANKAYITLSDIASETHHLEYVNDTAVLAEGTSVAARVNGVTYETLEEAITVAAAASSADKAVTIEILRDININANIAIPAGANIIITDDGNARSLTRGAGGSWSATARGVMFDVPAGATLTLMGTGASNSNPTLTIDGNNSVLAATSGNWAIINCAGTLNIAPGVRMCSNTSTGAGGAIRLDGGSNANITGGVFEGMVVNNNGAGVINVNTTNKVSISNAIFRNNASTNNSGAIRVNAGGNVVIDNCTFLNNKSTGEYGGAVYGVGTKSVKTTVKITNSHFEGNTAAKSGGAINTGNYSTFTIENCTFTKNVCTTAGSGAVHCSGNGTLHISGSTFTENEGQGANGGAVTMVKGTITGSTFTGNISSSSGGAINSSATSAANCVITDCVITGNTAKAGGGVYAPGGNYMTLDGCTITGNTSTSGQGADIQIAASDSKAHLVVKGTNKAPVFNVYFRNSSVMDLEGTLPEGGLITCYWYVDNFSDKAEGYTAVTFDSVETATANRQYIKLRDDQREVYHLDYSEGGAYAKLVSGKQIDVAAVDGVCYTDFTEAMTAAGEASVASGKVVTVKVMENVQTNATIAIPAGANIRIIDDGTARTISRSASFSGRGVMFDLINGNSSLEFVSTSGSNGNCTLIIDGNNKSSHSGNWAIVVVRGTSTLTVNSGVKFTNNYSGGAGAVIRVENYEGAKLVANGGVFEGNTSDGNTGGAINFLCTSTVSVVKNVVFRNNTATYGGAVILQKGVTTEFENCSFIGNVATAAQGAICSDGNAKVTDCLFSDNVSAGDGGAMGVGGTATVTNSTFTGNKGRNSGAIHVGKAGSATVEGGSFSGNQATNGYGGAISAWGGTLNVTGAAFTGNSATQSGGAILGYKGGASIVTLTNCTFTDNTADVQGGALAAWESMNTVINCTFTNNSATVGGAIHLNNQATSKLVVTGGTFTGNKATNGAGGAICASAKNPQVEISGAAFNQNNASGDGGAICASATVGVKVSDCTFTGNTANQGGALTIPTGSYLILHNVVCSGNSANAQGNDVRLGGATSKLSMSGKIVTAVYNRNKSTNVITGTLAEGSAIAFDWFVDATDGRIPEIAVQFDSEEAATASMPYITVGETCIKNGYALKQNGATAVLYQPAAAANEEIAEGEIAPAVSDAE